MTVDATPRQPGPESAAVSRRRFVRGLALGAVAVPVAGWTAACASPDACDRQQAAARAAMPVPPVLDAERPLDPRALADLARDRILLGAHWLAGVAQPDGAFAYTYDPETGRYDTQTYNEVRHAGVTWSLYRVFGAFGDDRARAAAEGGTRYIDAATRPIPRLPGRGFSQGGALKLGGHALAVVALVERRSVTRDTGLDGLVHDAADMLLGLELPGRPGQYVQVVNAATGARSAGPASGYYPGEALLALTRLAQEFPDGPYLAAAAQAADYLVHHRYGDLAAPGRTAPIDHWLTIALCRLIPLLPPDPAYRVAAFRLADAALADTYTAPGGPPACLGGAHAKKNINYTSTATWAEALVAAWELAVRLGDQDAIRKYSTAALRTAQFQLRVQFTDATVPPYPHPERVLGGWGANAVEPAIRIDYVQHNISALMGLHALVDGR